MNALLSFLLFALGAARADAPDPSWSPLRVSLDCESYGRVDACTYVRGYLDASELFLVVPRDKDQVRLIVGVTEVADDDLVLLRFISGEADLPAEYQLVQRVNSRATTDEQRAALEPAFRRGVAVYLSAVNPAAVSVTLSVPEDAQREDEPTSPWGASAWLGGWGEWTGSYQELSLWTGASAYRVTDTSKASFWGGGDLSASRSPSLDVDGHTVSLDSDSYSVYGTLMGERHLSSAWSVGGVARAGGEDPEGQYESTGRVHLGVSHDWFLADDPRGNQLSLTWLVGGQLDVYNTTNVIGEDRAFFPTQMLIADGSVRTDHTEISLDATAACQLNHVLRRNVLTLSGSVSAVLGDYVDLSLSGGITRQAIPGPAEIDTSSYEAVTQADYAEPLSVYGNMNLRVHRSNTNGARNDRFRAAEDLGATENL